MQLSVLKIILKLISIIEKYYLNFLSIKFIFKKEEKKYDK